MSDWSTVESAVEPIPVDGATCLEAGAGAGNTSAALAQRGAARVYAVTNDREHVTDVKDRFATEDAVRPVLADLQAVPLPDDSVDVTTAHALFGVLAPPEAQGIVEEITRVAAPGSWLAVVDYDPIDDDIVKELFAIENAASLLADGDSALTFYPEEHLRALFTAAGWEQVDAGTALEPVPWTAELLDAHTDITRSKLDSLPKEVQEGLSKRVSRVRERAGDGIDCGRMYYQTFRLSPVSEPDS